jgi:transcriptional regulator with XRE-family HTH domain
MDGNRLKQLREERGLTQKELSIIMGLKSPSAIGMIERSQLLPLNF